MSKNNKKNKNTKKNKVQDKNKSSVKPSTDKAYIRKKHNIWMWLIFLPPVGVYKSFKYKALPKFVNILLTIICLIIVVLTLDTMIYPNRVIDSNVKHYIEKKQDLGKVRLMYSTGTVDDKYIIYNVITTKGIYDVYVPDSSGKEVSAIQQIAPNKELILDNGFDVVDKTANSEILKFFNISENSDKFGVLEKVLETIPEGQIIKTSKGEYKFYLKYQQIIQIDEKKDNSYNKVYSKEPIIYNPKELQNVLNKRKSKLGELDKILSTTVNENNIDYIIQMKDAKLYKIRFELDGTVIIYNQD